MPFFGFGRRDLFFRNAFRRRRFSPLKLKLKEEEKDADSFKQIIKTVFKEPTGSFFW